MTSYAEAIREPGWLPRRLMAILLLGGAIGVGAVLIGVGLPAGVAMPIGFLAIGVLGLVLARWLGMIGFAGGLTGATIGLLTLIPAIAKATGLNGWIVFVLMVLVVSAGVYGAVKAIGRARTVAGASGRRKFAESRGWRYLAEANVPVPGPRSAPLFKSVPNDAVETTGTDVVFAVVQGCQAAVFDRMRAGARPQEGRQTVWLVRLPSRFPFVSAQVLGDQSAQHTASVPFASALLTDGGAVTPAARALPRWWWIEGEWLVSTADTAGARGASAADVDATLEKLAKFAAATDWARLAEYAV